MRSSAIQQSTAVGQSRCRRFVVPSKRWRTNLPIFHKVLGDLDVCGLHSVSQSVSQLVIQPVSQSISQLSTQPVIQLVGRATKRDFRHWPPARRPSVAATHSGCPSSLKLNYLAYSEASLESSSDRSAPSHSFANCYT